MVITAITASIGTAGVPGVGTIMLAMVFDSIGLPVEGVAMIMGIDRILDMGRTVVNITGDAVVTSIVAKTADLMDVNTFKNDDMSIVDANALEAPAEPTQVNESLLMAIRLRLARRGTPTSSAISRNPRCTANCRRCRKNATGVG